MKLILKSMLITMGMAAAQPESARSPAPAPAHFAVELGAVVHTVHPNYVSYVIDPASLRIDPPGVYPSYPYPADFESLALRSFARALSPAYFVINGGNNNCITYDGFGDDERADNANDGDIHYMSKYCKKKQYYGALNTSLWDSLLGFSNAAGADFVWHLNMAFGRGYAPQYVPWNTTEAQGLLNRSASKLAGVMLFEEVKASKVGFTVTPGNIGEDFKRLRAALALAADGRGRGDEPLVYGVLDQDSDQSVDWTNAAYAASAASVDVVCFSYYMNNAMPVEDCGCVHYRCGVQILIALCRIHRSARKGKVWPPGKSNHTWPHGWSPKDFCQYDPNATAAFLMNATARATLDTWSKHYVSLAKQLGKGAPHLTAGAPCTHAPEGTGWGAVNAWAGGLWYADALGRLAPLGVGVFARQTLFGGDYGLLSNATYAPTPGYWVALLHKRLMGTEVLDVTLDTSRAMLDGALSVFAHCARAGGAGAVALLAANLGPTPASLALPDNSGVELYLIDDAAGLLGTTPRLNGAPLMAGRDGTLPPLRGVAGASPLAVPGFSALFAVVDGTAAGGKECV